MPLMSHFMRNLRAPEKTESGWSDSITRSVPWTKWSW